MAFRVKDQECIYTIERKIHLDSSVQDQICLAEPAVVTVGLTVPRRKAFRRQSSVQLDQPQLLCLRIATQSHSLLPQRARKGSWISSFTISPRSSATLANTSSAPSTRQALVSSSHVNVPPTNIHQGEKCGIVIGQFSPIIGAKPAIGSVGQLNHVEEHRVEFVVIDKGEKAEIKAVIESLKLVR